MKKSIIYILLTVLVMGISTSCNNAKTGENETIKEDNTAAILEEKDSLDVVGDKVEEKEIGNTETEEKESQDIKKEDNEENKKEHNAEEDIKTENIESENKETYNTKEKNKENDSKDINKDSGNKSSGNKEAGNKESNDKGEKSKDSKNKETNNKGSKGKDSDKKGSLDKETGNKETGSSKDDNKQDVNDKDLLAIIDQIYEIKNPGIKLDNIAVDLSNSDSVKYYTGISDSSKVKKIAASEAMILSQAYSLVLVQLNDVADAQKVADEMLNGIDTRKWICVGADDLQVVSHEDVIMLFMVSSSLEENVTSWQIVDAFKEVCGGKLDIELKK